MISYTLCKSYYCESITKSLFDEYEQDQANSMIQIYNTKQGLKPKDDQSILTAACKECKTGILKIICIKSKVGETVIKKVQSNLKHTEACRFKNTENDLRTIRQRINTNVEYQNGQNKEFYDWWMIEEFNLLEYSNEKLLRAVLDKVGKQNFLKLNYPPANMINQRRGYQKRAQKSKIFGNCFNVETKIKDIYGTRDIVLEKAEENSPVVLDYELIDKDNYFIQISSKVHLNLYHLNRVRSPLNVISRPGVIGIDGTMDVLQYKNQTLIIIMTMDCNHKHTAVSFLFCTGERAEWVYRGLKNLEFYSQKLNTKFVTQLEKRMIVKVDLGDAMRSGITKFVDELKVKCDIYECERHFLEAVKKWFYKRRSKKIQQYSNDFLGQLEIYLQKICNATTEPQYLQLLGHIKDFIKENFNEETEEYNYIVSRITQNDEFTPTYILYFITPGVGYMNNGNEGFNNAFKKNWCHNESHSIIECLYIAHNYFLSTGNELKKSFKTEDIKSEQDKTLFPIYFNLKGTSTLEKIWQRVENELTEYHIQDFTIVVDSIPKHLVIFQKKQFTYVIPDIMKYLNEDSTNNFNECCEKFRKFSVYNVADLVCSCIYFAKYGYCKHHLFYHYQMMSDFVNPYKDLELYKKYPRGNRIHEPTRGKRYGGEIIKVARPIKKQVNKTIIPKKVIEESVREEKRGKENNIQKKKLRK